MFEKLVTELEQKLKLLRYKNINKVMFNIRTPNTLKQFADITACAAEKNLDIIYMQEQILRRRTRKTLR